MATCFVRLSFGNTRRHGYGRRHFACAFAVLSGYPAKNHSGDKPVQLSAHVRRRVPMCAAALCVHAKNKLLRPQNVGWLVFPACVGALGGAFAAHSAPNDTLRICFALFLIAVGIWQITVAVRFAAKLRRRRMVVFSSVRCLKAISPRLLKKRQGKA